MASAKTINPGGVTADWIAQNHSSAVASEGGAWRNLMHETRLVENRSFGITIHPRPMEGRPPGMGEPLMIDPFRTAVVLVDVQRFFLETPPFSAMSGILAPTARFLPVAREAGMTIVHVTTLFRADLADAGRPGSRTRQMMESVGGLPDGEGGGTLVAGSWSAAIPAELMGGEGDIVVVKKRFSGFAGTDLHDVLTARGIESLIFAGGTTTVCVESTVRDGVFLEYNPVVLSDCTADMTPDLHAAALERIDMFFGWVADSASLADALAGRRIRDAHETGTG